MANGDVLEEGLVTDAPVDVRYSTLNKKTLYNRGQQGVFGLHPLMTPKYALNDSNAPRDNEFRETLARMYLSLADLSQPYIDYYLKTVPNDPRVGALAQILALTGTGFIDFFLQQVSESHQEAVQIDKVLGDNYVAFFFGAEPPIFQFAGSLLNSMQDDQRTGFALAYQHLLRGTQLARRNALVRIRYDSVIMSGAMLSSNQTMNAENELIVPFQFNLLVKEMVWLEPWKGTKKTPKDFIKLTTDFDKEGVLGGIGEASDVRVRTTMNDSVEDPLGDETPQEATVAQGNESINTSTWLYNPNVIYGIPTFF